MRTKTVFLSAAALVAGVVSSMAQANVYSVNVVGYVNLATPAAQYALLANPLDDGTNTITSLDKGLPNKTVVQVWNGTGFTSSTKIAGAWGNNLSLPPGTGFFIQTPSAFTNTFVGSVAIATGATNSVSLPGGLYSLKGSVLPVAGTLTDSGPNTINLGGTLPNKSVIQVWNGTGYTASTKIAGAWGTPLNIAVGQGFFVQPFSTTNWSQTLQ